MDLDYPSESIPTIGTRLSLANGKPHNVGYSTVQLPFPLTKHSCDRMGIPHVDMLPSGVLNEIPEIVPLKDLEYLVPEVAEHAESLYHVNRWKPQLELLDLRSIEDLSKFVAIIRPKVRQMFMDHDINLEWECGTDKPIVLYQEDLIELISVIHDSDALEAERIRRSGNFPKNDSADATLLRSIHSAVNSHLMAKGHCLQVAHIILLQLNVYLS